MVEISTHVVEDDKSVPPQSRDEAPGFRDLSGFRSVLDTQRELIHSQLMELERAAILQCQITGTNPLSQEMEASVVGSNTGKRYEETLMPKALKCLYNVFSIKDTITKKEAHEMSALSGATVTQVRDFFSGQRSRVRKVVHLSHGMRNCDMFNSGQPALQISLVKNGMQETEGAGCTQGYMSLFDVVQDKTDGCSRELSVTERAEKLLNAMRTENNFFRQSQITELILQSQGSVLRCFMLKGGLQLIIKWLMQAVLEEQTSLIRLLLKTLTLMPLGSTLPRHMSLLLQTVNKLRFYRAQDVASCARSLLSRWSRFLKSPQIGKVSNSTGLSRMLQFSHKRNRDDINLHVESDTLVKKKSKTGVLVDSKQISPCAPCASMRKLVQPRDERASTPVIESFSRTQMGSIKLHGDCVKQKRKVQLVEEARASLRRRDVDGGRVSNFESTSRPLSADDIKKAKRRAYLLNSTKVQGPSRNSSKSNMSGSGSSTVTHYDQQNVVTSTTQQQSLEGLSSGKSGNSALSGSDVETASRVIENATVNKEKVPGLNAGYFKHDSDSSFQMVSTSTLKQKVKEGSSSTHCIPETGIESSQMQWSEPPRMYLDSGWSVASGDESFEIHSEARRLTNTQEVFYMSLDYVPPNPEEPAERVCLFVDDSLVPEILLEAMDDESLEREGSRQSPKDESVTQETDCNRLHEVSISANVRASILSVQSSVPDSVVKITENETSTPQMSGKLKYADPIMNLDGVATSGLDDVLEGANVESVSGSYPPYYFDHCRDTSVKLGNSIQGRVQSLLGSGYESLVMKAESLIHTLGSKGELIVPQGESATMNNLSTNTLREPRPTDCSLRPSDSTGLNVSQLSREACAEMLKVLLKQLADNGKGFGADLGLLSVFLKNPDLVRELMSSQNVSVGNHIASRNHATTVDSTASNRGNMENEIAKLLARVTSNGSTGGQYVPIKPAHTQVGDSYTRKSAEFAGSQIKHFEDESQSIAHQVGLLQVESTKLSQDVPMHCTGPNQIQSYGHTAKSSDQSARLASSVNWALPRVVADAVHPNSYHQSQHPSANQLVSGVSHPEALVFPALHRVQPSIYCVGSMNPVALTVEQQDIRMSSGILRMPEVSHVNHLVEPPMLMHSLNSQQSLVRGSAPSRVVGSTYLNYEHNFPNQFGSSQMIGSCIPPIQPPVLQGRSFFVADSVRPSLKWQPQQSQTNRGRHSRLG